jgi:hypothetical protein
MKYIQQIIVVQSANNHKHCEFKSHSGEVYSIQHYVIKFVSDLRQDIGFLPVLGFLVVEYDFQGDLIQGML